MRRAPVCGSAPLSGQINDRFMSQMATLADETEVREVLDPVTRSFTRDGRRVRALDVLGKDSALLLALTDPKFALGGVSNRQLREVLRGTPWDKGGTDKQLRITKAGNRYLRKLLVGCAHYILGPFGPDTDLRRYGMAIAARGGKNAKKRAAVAVARKLSVLLHRLWVSEEPYQPFYRPLGLNKAA